MQIEKLSKELKNQKNKSDEYGLFNKKMQAIADIWSILAGKRTTASSGLCMQQQNIRANNEYKYDSYIDAINYLVQADEIHREDVSELVDSYFPKDVLYEFKLEMEFYGFSSQNAEKFYKYYLDELKKKSE